MTGGEQRRVLCGPPRAAHLDQIRSHAACVSRAQMLAGHPRPRHHPPRITDDVENERRRKTVGNPLQRRPNSSTFAGDRVAALAREPPFQQALRSQDLERSQYVENPRAGPTLGL